MDKIPLPSSPLAFAIWAPLAPALALIVAGMVLYSERHRRAEDDVLERLEATSRKAASEISDSVARELVALDLAHRDKPTRAWPDHEFRLRRSSTASSFRVDLGFPETKSYSFPPDERAYLSVLLSLERRQDSRVVLRDIQSMARQGQSVALQTRLHWIQSQCLVKTADWSAWETKCREYLEHIPPDSEVQGVAAWWSAQIQLIESLCQSQQNEKATLEWQRLQSSVLSRDIYFPIGTSPWILEELNRAWPGKGPPRLDQRITQALDHQELVDSLSLTAEPQQVFDRGEEIVLLCLDPSTLSGIARRISLANVWNPRSYATDSISVTCQSKAEALQTESPLAAQSETLELLPWTVVARGESSLVETAFRPWRNAILITLLGVVLIAGLSAWFAARGVKRQLEVAALQEELVASISHELRTPLAGMMLQLEMLEDQRTSPSKRKQHLGRVQEGASRLQELVDSVLRFAKASHTPSFHSLSINQRLGKVSEEFAGRDSSIKVRSLPSDAHIQTDPYPLELVVQGLIENARKYTPEQTHVRLEAEIDGKEVRVWVEDNGPGVSTPELTRLFEPFYRGSESASRKPGVGLGLAIAKRVVEGSRGRIWAEHANRADSTMKGLRVVMAFPLEKTR